MEARTEWTDKRLDDLAEALRPLPAEVAKNTQAVDGLTEEVRQLRKDLTDQSRLMTTILAMLLVAGIGAFITLLVHAL